MRPWRLSKSRLARYFNPRTPCGVRHSRQQVDASTKRFQSTHPVRGATIDFFKSCAPVETFQSTHPVRGATTISSTDRTYTAFQSTHPVRGATTTSTIITGFCRFQSTHPVRGATDGDDGQILVFLISIHAPRAGCDLSPCKIPCSTSISIHAPRAGCDPACEKEGADNGYFNPRTPCGVRLWMSTARCSPCAISIHAPRAGCDYQLAPIRAACAIFQSTHPVRGATTFVHSFYLLFLFQSTHPVRGATMEITIFTGACGISIHAPRAGCDGKFDGFTRPNLRKRYKKVSVQPKKRAKKKIKEMLCSHSHIFGWISGAKVPEFPAR